MEVLVRDMRIKDVSEIIKYDLIMLGESFGEATILEHLTNNSLMKYLIMESIETSEIVGQMSLWIDEDKAQINNFYIIKKYQGLHLGKKFLKYVISYLKNIKVNEITLEVRSSNLVAIKLYESFMFKTVTIRKNYYSNGEDAYMMYLRIGSD